MTEKPPVSKKGFSADWLLRGSLAKIGDTFDRLTGRRWVPSSSLATSELIERIKKLLDAEARQVPGKGTVVPHNIKLKMQWDKFSTDAEDELKKLEYQLLAATADHINDSLYYTYAPLSLEVKPDYFIEGVKLFVSFDKFTDEERDAEMNVTVPAIQVADVISDLASTQSAAYEIYIARFEIKGIKKEKRLEFLHGVSLSVGRTGSNDLVIDDVSISKIHGSLSVNAEGALSVADTGSTNGTFLNDQRISYGKATRLETSNRVKFGSIEVTFEYVPRPIAVESDEDDDIARSKTVEIDGFEFTRRESAGEANKADDEDNVLPTISIPDETLKLKTATSIDPTPGKSADTLLNEDESAVDKLKPEGDLDV